jgi:polysaccharide export outer membrane protein
MPAFPTQPETDYRIGSLDLLNITVFQVADLSLERAQVDAAGNILMPLIGAIHARGLTSLELSEEIRRRLAADHLQNPQVSVMVAEAASQKVTVDGAVVEPGVFQMRGNTTLIQAVAMAKGPTRTAEIRRVAVFRVIEGQRMVALYDLRAIRRGEAQDPQILGDDVVVVDQSRMNALFRDIVSTLPAFAIFRPF